MLYIGRVIGGLAGGVCCVVAPSYIGTYIRVRFLFYKIIVRFTITGHCNTLVFGYEFEHNV